MFGDLGNLAGMLKHAKSLQENVQKMQEGLAEQIYEADAGAGMVRVRVNGKLELVEVKIDPKAAEDIELLEDLIKAAVASAIHKTQEAVQAEMSKLTGGLNIPGLADLINQGT